MRIIFITAFKILLVFVISMLTDNIVNNITLLAIPNRASIPFIFLWGVPCQESYESPLIPFLVFLLYKIIFTAILYVKIRKRHIFLLSIYLCILPAYFITLLLNMTFVSGFFFSNIPLYHLGMTLFHTPLSIIGIISILDILLLCYFFYPSRKRLHFR